MHLCQVATSTISLLHEDFTVEDFWDENNGGKWVFVDLLPKDVLKSIASCEVIKGDEVEDEVVWDGSTCRGFSIKFALSIIRSENAETKNTLWHLIWKLQVPQIIHYFAGLTAYDRLMTNAHIVQRGPATDPRCKGCLQGEEDTLHILRDCKFAHEVRQKLIAATNQGIFFTLPLHTSLMNNLENSWSIHSKWPTLLTTVICWFRNGRSLDILKILNSSHFILGLLSTIRLKRSCLL